MFCAKCGKEIDNDSTFCPFCGQNTNEPVESGGGGKPKVSVKMPGKKVIGGIAAVAVMVLVVFGISKVIGGISNRAKSLPEKLFAMSAEDYVSLTREGLKDMLEEEGTLYEEWEKETNFAVSTLTTDKFMGYDCIYSYSNLSSYSVSAYLKPTKLVDYTYFKIAFETEEDFKEGQKSIKKYLEKEMVKKSGILKDGDTDIYLVECSDKGVDEIWKKLSEMDDREDFYDRWISAYRALAERTDIIGEDSQINEEALLKTLEDMDYKIYKFVRVSYPPMDSIRNSFPSEKSYADYACYISVLYLPMTEGEYIVAAGKYGFDAISGKEIDEESVDKNLVNMYLDELGFNDSESRRNLEEMYYFDLYMMVNHKFDTHSKTYIESEDERKLWYIRYFRWDTDTDALIDLSNYRNSIPIYCAAECNYNYDAEEYFESELDRALYLADADYKANTGENFGGADDKRLWFMQNYSYDTLSGKTVDKEVVDALIAYEDYFNHVKDNITGVTIRGKLIYLNDDNIPDCVLFDDMQANSSEPAASTIYFLSYINGKVMEEIIELGHCDFQYAPKSGIICVGGDQGSYDDYDNETMVSYGGHEIIKLTDSFESIGSTSWSQVCDFSGALVGEEYKLNDSAVGSMEDINNYIQSLECNESVETWKMTSLYKQNEGIKSSFLNLYDEFRTTTYGTYEYCIYECELKDGILTVKADDGVNASSSFGKQTAFEFSYPVADNCIWEAGNGFGEYRSEYTYPITPEEVELEIVKWRNEYDLTPGYMESPVAIQFHIIDDLVVGVYTSTP